MTTLLERYQDAADVQRESMLGAQMEMDIDARFTQSKESGRMRVLRTISRLGEMGLKTLVDFTGDNRVKKELIARYLEEEQNSKAYGVMKITPDDYEFDIRAILRYEGRETYVFGVKPRKGKGSFRGELWIDGKTAMPLREAGEYKSPSVFLTNLRFSRDYELRDGISVVKQFHSSTDVRLLGIGRAELDVNFSNYAKTPEEQASR